VLNNGGYTIERMIHGYKAEYNDIADWDYQALFKTFGPQFTSRSYKVETPDELDKLLNDEDFIQAQVPQVSLGFS
jgi:pyruvate decarboxylase